MSVIPMMNPTESLNSEYAKIWFANNKPIPTYEVVNDMNNYDSKKRNFYQATTYEMIDNKKNEKYNASGKVLIIRINNNYKLLNTFNTFESDIVIPKLHDIFYDKDQFDIEYKLSEDIKYELVKSELNEVDFLTYDDLQCDINELEDTLKSLCKIKETLGYGGNKCYLPKVSQANTDTKTDTNTDNKITPTSTIQSSSTLTNSLSTSTNPLSTPIDVLNKNLSNVAYQYIESPGYFRSNCSDNKFAEGITTIHTRIGQFYEKGHWYNKYDPKIGENSELNVEPYFKTRLDDFESLDDSMTNGFNKNKLVIVKSLFYNKLFFTGAIACNITPDILSKYFKELQEISQLNVKITNQLSDSLATLFKNDIFDTFELFEESVNNLITNATDKCPNLFDIKKFIENTYNIDDNPDNRIQFTNILNNVNRGLCVPTKFHEMMKKSLPLVLMELGLNKKRYSNGFYWYGMVEKPKEEVKIATFFEKICDNEVIDFAKTNIEQVMKYVSARRSDSLKKGPEEYRKEELRKTEEKFEDMQKRYPIQICECSGFH